MLSKKKSLAVMWSMLSLMAIAVTSCLVLNLNCIQYVTMGVVILMLAFCTVQIIKMAANESPKAVTGKLISKFIILTLLFIVADLVIGDGEPFSRNLVRSLILGLCISVGGTWQEMTDRR